MRSGEIGPEVVKCDRTQTPTGWIQGLVAQDRLEEEANARMVPGAYTKVNLWNELRVGTLCAVLEEDEEGRGLRRLADLWDRLLVPEDRVRGCPAYNRVAMIFLRSTTVENAVGKGPTYIFLVPTSRFIQVRER